MAETYLTPAFQNATRPQDQSAPGGSPEAQTGGEQYQTDTFKKAVQGGGGQQTGDQGGAQTQPSQGWGVNWRTGDVTMPQSAQDWGTVAGNEAAVGLPALLGQKAQIDAARQRLGPAAAASADVAGNILSPTTLLNAVGGPELAGALHEGIKSAATNWNTDESWGDYLKRVGEDTGGGAALGGLGHGAAALAPKVLPQLTKEGVKAALTYGVHKVAGGLAGGDIIKEAIPLLGVYQGLDKVGEKAGEWAGSFAGSPATRQAIQNFILGGGSAARTAAGPYDQWMPGP